MYDELTYILITNLDLVIRKAYDNAIELNHTVLLMNGNQNGMLTQIDLKRLDTLSDDHPAKRSILFVLFSCDLKKKLFFSIFATMEQQRRKEYFRYGKCFVVRKMKEKTLKI